MEGAPLAGVRRRLWLLMWFAVAGLGILSVFLLLTVLGALRELAILRTEVTALANRPSGSQEVAVPVLDSRVRGVLEGLMRPANGGSARHDETYLVAFVSPGCTPCAEFGSGLDEAAKRGQVDTGRVLSVVSWASETECRRFAAVFPGTSVVDAKGEVADACNISGTPTFVFVSGETGEVSNYTQAGRLEWIVGYMNGQMPKSSEVAPSLLA